MDMPKASEQDKQYFQSVVPDRPGVEIKPMFGNFGAFVNGNMFAGLFGALVGVKLDDASRAELASVEGTGLFGPPERPMGRYTSLPVAWRSTPELAAHWVELACSQIGLLPPKATK
ncbi:MAG TPA: TfoX/Sxy family protein [Streptosporangiaceae bacterium]|jgi:TfoX/Sxy family transcriptional regulator of competence genes